MPSPIAHSITGYILANVYPLDIQPQFKDQIIAKILPYAIFIANVPDFDFILEIVTGENYHRTFTHSLFFGFCFSLIISSLFARWFKLPVKRFFLLTLLIYLSHLFLDTWTVVAPIQLFWPFSLVPVSTNIALFSSIDFTSGFSQISDFNFVFIELLYSLIIIFIFWGWKGFNQKRINR